LASTASRRASVRSRRVTRVSHRSAATRRAGHCDAQRLRNLAEPALKLCREIVERRMNRWRRPTAPCQPAARGLSPPWAGHRRRDAWRPPSDPPRCCRREETAVLCHLLQSLGALALREDHALEQSLIAADRLIRELRATRARPKCPSYRANVPPAGHGYARILAYSTSWSRAISSHCRAHLTLLSTPQAAQLCAQVAARSVTGSARTTLCC